MATIEHEREAKFDAPDDFEIPELHGVTVVEESSVELVATYWDTPDRRLLRWGHTLRRRRASDGSEDGWTLKLGAPPSASDVVVDREEIQVDEPSELPPTELRDLVTGVVRTEPIVPVATIVTDRHRVVLKDRGAHDGAAVEVSDDRVSSTVGDEPGTAFRQIEVEAKAPGSDPLIEVVAERLREAGASGTTSTKLAMVLGDPLDREIVLPRLGPDASIDAVVQVAIGTGATQLIGNDPGVRLGKEPEAVHKARVATCRLRSDLKTLEPLFESSRMEWLRTELAWVGELLGAVRDLDVLIGRLHGRPDGLPDEEREAAAAIVETIREERRIRHLELVDRLASARHVSLVDQLVEASGSPPLAPGVDRARPARPKLRTFVRKAWRRTDRAVGRLDEDPTDDELHEIRKRAKRARYAAELAAGVFGRDADRFAKRLEEVQDILGELQDAVFAEGHLRSIGRDRLEDGAAFTAGALVCMEQETKRKAREAWPRIWRTARAKGLRRWLR
jgi:CHAD domain-containing protein